MLSELLSARELANNVRFSDDAPTLNEQGQSRRSLGIKNSFYCNELAISEQVTPALDRSLSRALLRLQIPRSAVEAFVYASPEINAQCLTGNDSECVIRLSSALIEILTAEELEFVIGHELGHFLLSHHGLGNTDSAGSLEDYIQYRAQEISADRIGVIASGSLEVALKAMLKTISGLSGQHLRFDISKFISQIRSTKGTVSQHSQSTHPSVLVRGRALLWFSIAGFDASAGSQGLETTSITDVDRRVRADMDRYVDGAAKLRLKEASAELAMWLCADSIVETGSFSKKSQERFKSDFGEETLVKLMDFLKDQSKEENRLAVLEKIKLARSLLEVLMPSSYQAEYTRLAARYRSFG
jgi:hypothetical protein